MTGSAIYDALTAGPELISLPMTGVLIVYSSLFACHATNVVAQCNQIRRAVQAKYDSGDPAEREEVILQGTRAAGAAAASGVIILRAPSLQAWLVAAELGPISAIAAAPAGPFSVHFWAPMSKWFISGASFLELDRPTDKVSLTLYSALTLTGLFFTRYALLVTPINYVLCSVNLA